MRYRTAAIFAGFGLAVALVAGLAGRVPLSTVLLRALAGAAVFGALGLATVSILERFVPEVFARVKAAEPAQAAAPASTIDIVLPEESPLGGEFADELEAADGSGVEPLENLGGAEREAADELPASDVEAVGPMAAEAVAESVDALPGLDGLDLGDEAPAAARTAAPRSPAAGAVDTTDPSLAARALRTWLKRDHEG